MFPNVNILRLKVKYFPLFYLRTSIFLKHQPHLTEQTTKTNELTLKRVVYSNKHKLTFICLHFLLIVYNLYHFFTFFTNSLHLLSVSNAK